MKTVFREKDPVFDPTRFEGEAVIHKIEESNEFAILVIDQKGQMHPYTIDGRRSKYDPITLSFTPYELNVNQVRPDEEIKDDELRLLCHFQHWLGSNYNNLPCDSGNMIKRARKFLKENEQAFSLFNAVNQRELLLDFANYSESDKTSQTTDECVDNYLDSIK